MHELRGTAVVIALVTVTFFASLAGVLVVLGWTGFSIYALVKMIGGGSDEANATGIMVGVVLMITTMAALFAGTIKLVGRSMEPRKRDRSAPDPDGF